MDAVSVHYALGYLLSCKPFLNRQTYKTLKGQILAGDPDGAMRYLGKLKIYQSTNAIRRH